MITENNINIKTQISPETEQGICLYKALDKWIDEVNEWANKFLNDREREEFEETSALLAGKMIDYILNGVRENLYIKHEYIV